MELARANGVDLCDEASAFEPVKLNFVQPLIPRPHQDAAYAAWKRNKWRGIVALPSGGGKSFLAAMAIRKLQRPALILVPTIDLLLQWHSLLKKLFGVEIGMLGGGEKRVLPITVSTYDSAVIYMEELGGSFALLICDECHHLPGAVYPDCGGAEYCAVPVGIVGHAGVGSGSGTAHASLRASWRYNPTGLRWRNWKGRRWRLIW